MNIFCMFDKTLVKISLKVLIIYITLKIIKQTSDSETLTSIFSHTNHK